MTKFILLIVIVVAIGVGWFWVQGQQKPAQPTNKMKTAFTTSPPQTITEGWVTLKRDNFSIKHPPKAAITNNPDDPVVVISIPRDSKIVSQELYDGTRVAIIPNSLKVDPNFQDIEVGDKKLKLVLEELLKNIESKNERVITSPLKEITIAGIDGYTYNAKTQLNNRYIFLPKNEKEFIQIVDATSDPQNEGFQVTADLILSTFEFID